MNVRAALLQLADDAPPRHLDALALPALLDRVLIACLFALARLQPFLLRLDRLAFPTAGHMEMVALQVSSAGKEVGISASGDPPK